MNDKVSKSAVDYRKSNNASKRCGTCVMFRKPDSCTLVKGTISKNDVCDRWYPEDKR